MGCLQNFSIVDYQIFYTANMSDELERSDGKIVKMEVDYSSTVDQRVPECEKMAKVSRV